MTIFTQDDLLLFLYNELPQPQATLLDNALQTDAALLAQYVSLQETTAALDAIPMFSPPEELITSLLSKVEEQGKAVG